MQEVDSARMGSLRGNARSTVVAIDALSVALGSNVTVKSIWAFNKSQRRARRYTIDIGKESIFNYIGADIELRERYWMD